MRRTNLFMFASSRKHSARTSNFSLSDPFVREAARSRSASTSSSHSSTVKRKELVRRDAHDAMIERMAGLVLTIIGGWPARIAGTDLGLRRKAEALVFEMRKEMAEAAIKLADEQGEPPLDEQE